MTNGLAENYDFRKPTGLSGDNGELLRTWMNNFSNLFKEKWLSIVPTELEVCYQSDSALSFDVAKSRYPRPAFGFHIAFGDPVIDSVFILERKTALTIAMQMTGDAADEIEDRELTSIENSLIEMFIRELVGSISESWIDQEPLEMTTRETIEQPHRSRMFSPREIMINMRMLIQSGESEFELLWIVPQAPFEHLLSEFSQVTETQENEYRGILEEKTKEMKIQLTVSLGDAELTLNQLTNLAAGDVVRLTQKISDPLAVRVEAEEKFLAWPGRQGKVQAVKICQNLQ